MIRLCLPALLLSILSIMLALPAEAQLRMPAVFSDHMVLQQRQRLTIWGWADPGEKVEVRIAGRKATAQADAAGRWAVRLAPLRAGGPYEMVVEGRVASLTLSDVLVGEVWICSGQSNMEWPLSHVRNAEEEVRAADHPRLRLLTVARKTADAPQEDFEGRWSVCTPETAPKFSAVGYFFGRALLTELDVPVGLINSSWGGTVAEAWVSAEALAAEPETRPILDAWQKRIREYPAAVEKYQEERAAWQAAGSPAGKEPRRPSLAMQNAPARLYNGMIAPLLPFPVRGAIWYQGESNAGRAHQYRKLLPLLIRDWRAAWSQPSLAFGIVQLANFYARKPQPAESSWAELREAQNMALRLPHTGLAVAIDIGDASDIHPRNKQDVGARLAAWALARVYRVKMEYSGPSYRGMKIDDGSILLHFAHVGGGLVLKEGQAFAIAGEDRRFVWANARVEGERVRVWSPAVPRPVAVRYAWADNPDAVLFNAAGFPASPFRTDDWPGLTVGNLTP